MRSRRYILILLVGLALAGLGYYCFVPRVSASRLRQEVEEQLPLGTPRKDVEDWLKARGIAYTGIIDRTFREVGIGGWVYNTGPRVPLELVSTGPTAIHMAFYFDEQGRLRRLYVEDAIPRFK
jgi:hypothetical protein